MRGQLVEAEHLARYEWAAQLCSGRRVLDVGCGAGYGSELLHRAGAMEVVGIDNSATALDLARSNVSSGVTCELGDARELAFPDDWFDLVVCFELIEHVDDQARVLDEVARVLRADGLLVLSSPNRDRYVPGNPHHRHELLRDELQGLLDVRFPSARILSQHVMLASVVGWTQGPVSEDGAVQRVAAPDEDDELYLVAMAGSKLPPDPDSVVSLTRFAEPRAWLEHINGQQRHIETLTRYQRDLEGREADRREALGRLAEAEGKLAEAEGKLADLTASLQAELQTAESAHAREIARITDEVATMADRLSTITASRSWRLTRPIRHAGATLRGR